MRGAIFLLLLLGCDAPPAPPPVPVEKPVPKKEPEPESEPEPVVVDGSPFTVDDLRELGFPKALVMMRAGSFPQNKFSFIGHKHAISLYVEWRPGGDKEYEVQRAESAGGVDENRYGSRSYIVRVSQKGDEYPIRHVEIGFLIGGVSARVLAGNSDQEVLEKDLERVARGAAEKLHAKLK